jgi:hypothetical protein
VVSESILGDLWEEYSTRRVRSAWGAATWYWVAAIRLGLERGSRRAASATANLLEDIGKGGLGMLRNVKHALAGLARRPLFTDFAVLSVAIGIGAATAASSVLNAVFLRSQDGVTE